MISLKIPTDRFAFLEMLAYWKGLVRNKDLEQQFGITRQQVHKDFTLYQELHPETLVKLDKACFGFAPSSLPHYASTSLDSFFLWLETGHFSHSSGHSSLCATRLQLPERQVSRLVVAALIAAIERGQRLDVEYVSVSNPDHGGRIFSPHSIVKAGSRYHVRGYCEKSSGFRDLVLSRFRSVSEVEGPARFTREKDEAWNTFVNVLLAPDPRLSPIQQQVLANDYCMEGGQLILQTRAALVDYLLKDMQVNIKYLDGTAEAQQLVLVNKNDIKQWLFDA
ncbi:WYL domain-containing protein [Shewanella sedimentimangrovi]|uniref:WYL domain-containing protein n=1 Tax=Shewanella sedimentimangrovi TaxID=2814293 RepID=A0ABX7R180_9GAMM|nr:WYL domain-containing protein [Shewanella sedimentimangrovi]QSX37557.1 WYL domain-containing protein [Shewanella sedimentimangrovi]